MRRLELLIDVARKLSQNTRYDSDAGVPQDIFVQYFNNAQDSLVKEIVNSKSKFFKKTKTIPVVNGQEIYSWPDDMFVQHVDTLQWSQVAQKQTYYTTLFRSYVKERVTSQVGYAFSYIPYEDGFHLNPPLGSGQLILAYTRKPDSLGKRAGKIDVVTIGSGILTALEVDNTEASYDETEINKQNYLCIVDRDGKIKARNIPYDSVSGGVFTLSPYTLAATDAIAVGDYIVVGKNVVNLPDFPDICESYLLKHAVYEARYGDSSQWNKEAKADMAMNLSQLMGVFGAMSDDIVEIPVSNLDYLSLI